MRSSGRDLPHRRLTEVCLTEVRLTEVWFGSTRAVVTRLGILAVADRWRVAAGDADHGLQQPSHVLLAGIDAGARPDRPGHLAAVAAAELIPVTVDVLMGMAKQAHQVGMRAETAVPHADRFLGGQPRGYQPVRDPVDRERGHWRCVCIGAGAEQAGAWYGGEPPAQRRRDPALVAGQRRRAAVRRAWSPASGWSGWIHLGGAITGSPDAVYDPLSGNLEVYAVGTSGALYQRCYRPNGTWSGWSYLGGALTSV